MPHALISKQKTELPSKMADDNPTSCFCIKLTKPKSAAADKVETTIQEALDNALDDLAVAVNAFLKERNIDAPTDQEVKVFEFLKHHNLVPKEGKLDLAPKLRDESSDGSQASVQMVLKEQPNP